MADCRLTSRYQRVLPLWLAQMRKAIAGKGNSADSGTGHELAPPVPLEITGVPEVRHRGLGHFTLYRRRTRSRSSAAVIVPRA